MLTFTQRKLMAARLCAINYEEPEMETIVTNINQADKLFQNAARRPWTNMERTFDLEASKQYYQLQADMNRVVTVRCKQGVNSSVTIPLTEIRSEMDWNKINSYPHSGLYPTHFFIRGHKDVGIYPMPASDVADGLIITYEPRVRDMHKDDVNFTANVTNGSAEIVSTQKDDQNKLVTVFEPYMVGDWYAFGADGTDGNYYKIKEVTDGQHATLEEPYLGTTATDAQFTIGQAPPYPEEYHDAAVNYACYRFFAMRKDTDSAAMYRTLFQDALTEYKTVYGNKTVSGVINPNGSRMPTIGDVFANSTITEGV